MNILQDIVIALALIVIVISIRAIYYFIGRIVAVLHRWDDDIPSPDELSKHYQEINKQNGGNQHPR